MRIANLLKNIPLYGAANGKGGKPIHIDPINPGINNAAKGTLVS